MYGGTPGTGVKQEVGPITETQTGKCLDDRGAGIANGTAVQIYSCNGTGGLAGHPESGRCLTDPSNGATSSTQLDIAACTGSVGQLCTLPSG